MITRKIIDSIFSNYSHAADQLCEDANVIATDYLIHNIDYAFDRLSTNRRMQDITFELFCEYVLPYKWVEKQPLDHWRDTRSDRFGNTIETTFCDEGDINKISLIANLIIDEMEDTIRYTFGIPHNDYGFLSASTMYKIPYGLCSNYTDIFVSILRSQGIPAAVDMTPQWGHGPLGHTWCTIFDNDGRSIVLPWGFDKEFGSQLTLHSPLTKVYRRTYKPDERTSSILNRIDLPSLAPYRFLKDVTDEYRPVSNIIIPVFKNAQNHEVAGIAAFDRSDWNVIGLGEVKNGKAYFDKLGRGVVYLVYTYDGTKFRPGSYPFILHYDGDIQMLIPDTVSSASVELRRKYFKTEHVAKMENRIRGGRIEASDSANFKNPVKLFEFTDMNYPDLIPIRINKPYRYWRFRGADSSYCSINELHFYERGKNTILKGRIIGTKEALDSLRCIGNVFDGDWLTGFDYIRANGGWVGLDFGKPVFIESVRCVPRSDDNAIHFGDTYELKYWGKDGWVSLGIQKAESGVLYCESVPPNALLILHNHTRGTEERIFTWEDDKQKWW